MDNPCRSGTLLPVSIYMTHHVVPDDLLPLPGYFIIDVILILFQFFDLLLRDPRISLRILQTEFLLCFRQGDP